MAHAEEKGRVTHSEEGRGKEKGKTGAPLCFLAYHSL